MRTHRHARIGRRVAAAGLAVTTLGAGLFAATAPAATAVQAQPAAPASQSLVWGPCATIPAQPGVPASECATMSVPQDWDLPKSGQTLSIAVSRTRATDPAQRKGILMTNPGGPGGAGLNLPSRIAAAHPELAKYYDIIGMDPRGVGASTQLKCGVSYYAVLDFNTYDLRDNSPAATAVREKYTKSVADGCAKNPLTPFINTWQTVHDVDAFRKALGEPKLNYLGYSYGTWLGAKYAAVFPKTTGKVVLDSNTGWMGDLSETWQAMPASMQRRFDQQFVPWVARHKVFSKYVGTTPKQVLANYNAARAGAVITGTSIGYGILPSGVESSLIQGIYTDAKFVDNALLLSTFGCYAGVDGSPESIAAVDPCIFDRIAKLIEEYYAPQGLSAEAVAELTASVRAPLTGDFQAVAAAAPDALPPMFKTALEAAALPAEDPVEPEMPVDGVYYAVRCGDGGNWHTPAWWAKFRQHEGKKNWLAGYQLGGTEVCAYWTAPTRKLPNPDPKKLGPVLMVQSEFDPATAYENTTTLQKKFNGALRVSVDDAGMHGVYALRGNGCADDIVDAWLIRNVKPAKNTVCGTYPLPDDSVVYPVNGPVDKLPHHGGKLKKLDRHVESAFDRLIGRTH